MSDMYRKELKNSDTWHFCSNCRNWPTSDYVGKTVKPTYGKLCNECQTKKRDNDCK